MPFTVDTASAVSIVGEDTYYKYLSHLQLQEPQINLKGYTGHEVKLLGQVDVAVKYEDQEKVLPLVIAKGDGTSLFGRRITEIELDWGSLFSGKLGRGVQPPGTLLRGVPSDPAVVERRYHTGIRVVPRSKKTLGYVMVNVSIESIDCSVMICQSIYMIKLK